jgi:hypothetical protein
VNAINEVLFPRAESGSTRWWEKLVDGWRTDLDADLAATSLDPTQEPRPVKVATEASG